MLNEERKSKILEVLSQRGRVLSSELVAELNVSEDTIRRDLKDLALAGAIKRVHGGALPIGHVEFSYEKRQKESVGEKSAIAKRAAALICPGQVVFIDGGTTTALVASYLPKDLKATFITYSLPTAIALTEQSNCHVRLLGGRVVKDLLLTMGPGLLKEIETIQADLTLISAESVHGDFGATVSHPDDALVKCAFIQQSAETAILAGSEKFGKVAPYRIARLNEVASIITDTSIDTKELEACQKAGGSIIVV
ncbi:DeoR/GlpR family DNA-binding transcription regulator [soil metagenome]